MTRQYQRHIEKRYKDGKPLCLIPICQKTADKYKNGNYRNYCERHSGYHMRTFTNWQGLSQRIIERDGNKCVKCGDDKRYIEVYRNETELCFPRGDLFSKGTRRKKRRMLTTISNLEVDHIKEVADGGDMWDEDNLQTLCYKCHKQKTAHFLRFRNSIGSSEQKTLLEMSENHKRRTEGEL